MIKKLITLSVVLLLPVSFITSASAASKSVTCYKGTAIKVVKNSTSKCPTGWSTKKPITTKAPVKESISPYKIQDISPSEVASLVKTYNSWRASIGVAMNIYDECKTKLGDPDQIDSEIQDQNSSISDATATITNFQNEIATRENRLAQIQDTPEVKSVILNEIDSYKSEILRTNKEISNMKAIVDSKIAQVKLINLELPKCSKAAQSTLKGPNLTNYYATDGSTEIIVKKLVSNFCGLNINLLENNFNLISNADPLVGIDRYNKEVMTPFYSNLRKISLNRDLSVNTTQTDAFLKVIYSRIPINYDNNIYIQKSWEQSLSTTEYGVSVITPNFTNMKNALDITIKFCKRN